jgi:CubicO group peptidase (beta-lactamase class C family)
VDELTIGRAGSVTKLFTVYALLVMAGIGVFDKPVTDYLPELRRAPASSSSSSSSVNKGGKLLDRIRWEEITIGALTSHQAGSGGVRALLLEHVREEEPTTPEGKQY